MHSKNLPDAKVRRFRKSHYFFRSKEENFLMISKKGGRPSGNGTKFHSRFKIGAKNKKGLIECIDKSLQIFYASGADSLIKDQTDTCRPL